MDSGYRNSNPTPSDTYVSTPALDLGLPVEAELQMKISYYAYLDIKHKYQKMVEVLGV